MQKNREKDGRVRYRLVIRGILPNLNDYISAERRNKHIAAAMKRQTESGVSMYAKSQLRGVHFERPVRMDYTWYEPNRRRDKDNIVTDVAVRYWRKKLGLPLNKAIHNKEKGEKHDGN